MTATIEDLRSFANTVRPYKGATRLAGETHATGVGEMTIELHRGAASQGWKSDYDKVETWWVVNYVKAHGRTFGRGTRYSGKRAEAKARKDYADACTAAREG
jgi:hypothetical protein